MLQAECAEWLDVSERKMRQLIDEGVLDRQPFKQYDAKKAVVQYIRHLRSLEPAPSQIGTPAATPQAEFAEWLDLSPRRYRELVDEGVLSRSADLKSTMHQYVRNLREVAAGRAAEAEPNNDEARRLKAQADKAEMEVQEKRRELVRVDQVAESLLGVVMVMKTRLTAIPAKAAPLVGSRDMAVAEKVIRELVNEALAELANCEFVGTPAA